MSFALEVTEGESTNASPRSAVASAHKCLVRRQPEAERNRLTLPAEGDRQCARAGRKQCAGTAEPPPRH